MMLCIADDVVRGSVFRGVGVYIVTNVCADCISSGFALTPPGLSGSVCGIKSGPLVDHEIALAPTPRAINRDDA